MSRQQESRFKSELSNKLKKIKAAYYVPTYSSNRGLPDITALFKGIHYALELKINDRLVTALQIDELEKVDRNGGRAFIVRYYPDKREIIAEKVVFEKIEGSAPPRRRYIKEEFVEQFPELLNY